MQKVRINKEKLRDVVQENRNNHRDIFEKAIEGYRKAVINRLEQMIDDAKANRKINTFVNLTQPEDHTEDYDQVLEMLELSVDDTIELTHSEFAQYVQDRWSWSGKFMATSSEFLSN